MFIYLVAVSGIMIHLHYCGQTLESWTVYDKTDGCAEGECGDETEQSDDCCTDEVITAKIAQDQHHISALKLKLATAMDADAVLVPDYSIARDVIIRESNPGTLHKANAPPGLWQNTPLYKLHSSFTYYG